MCLVNNNSNKSRLLYNRWDFLLIFAINTYTLPMKTYSKYLIFNESNQVLINPYVYMDFYKDNIHPYITIPYEDKEERVYEGITVDEFCNNYERHHTPEELLNKVFSDERLGTLQEELENEGKDVCMVNLYMLSLYLIERAKSRYVILLKPTLQETFSKINDVTKITFTNSDGTKSETTSQSLIKEIKNLLGKKNEESKTFYEVDKIVTWDEVANTSIILSYFVHDMTEFLNTFFPVKRKKDAKISTKEVDLILYLMQDLGLLKSKVTNKRYWQLMNIYEHLNKHSEDLLRMPLNGTSVLIPTLFLPYSIWSKNNIDWAEEDLPKLRIEEGMTIQF